MYTTPSTVAHLQCLLLAITPMAMAPVPGYTQHKSASQNLATARREAAEFGQIRRQEIRRRVRASQVAAETEAMEAEIKQS